MGRNDVREMTAEHLTRLLDWLQLSQAQCARALGVSKDCVWKWCHGRRRIPQLAQVAMEDIAARKAVERVRSTLWLEK